MNSSLPNQQLPVLSQKEVNTNVNIVKGCEKCFIQTKKNYSNRLPVMKGFP